MRAARITRLDGPAAIDVGEVATPEPTAGQVLIEVTHAGVTFPEVLLSRGEYQLRPELPFIPGSEVSGHVVQAPESSGLHSGDRVAAFPGFGGFAEYVTADPRAVFRLPDAVSLPAAAALPMNYFTVDFALHRRAGLQPGHTVLVHGAAGGVGTAAIQVAKAAGAKVIAVVSDQSRVDIARRAGADEVILAESFLASVKELTSGRGVDVVVDPVGGERFTDSLRALAVEGQLLVIGFTAGEIPTVKVNRLLLNNISVVGVGWGAFWLPRIDYLAEQWQRLSPLAASGQLDPPITNTYPLSSAAEAVAALEQRTATGKVLLEVRG
jgi:NADPH:quinone reductase